MINTVSKLALAAALSLGVATIGAAPAVAQKQPKPEAPKPLQVSDEYRKAAAAAEAAVKSQDWATAETQLSAAEAVSKNDDEKFYAASLRLQIEAHNKSSEGMIKALDVLIPSPRTTPATIPYLNFLRGNAAFLLKRYADGLPYLLKARELGSTEVDLPVLIAQTYFNTGNPAQGITEMSKAMDIERAAGRKPPEAWYKFVVAKVYKTGDRPTTAVWLMRQAQEYPTLLTWRTVIVLYRDGLDQKNTPLDRLQKLDLFRLMRATGALADQNDYLDYAQAAINSGLPWEAIAVIQEGRTAGKLPQAEPISVKFLASAQTMANDEGPLEPEAKRAAAAATGKEAAATASAFLASGNYARALELYDLALQKGSVDTNAVNLSRGVALFHLGRKPEARTAFGAVQGSPASDIAHFWIGWIDLPNPPTA